MRKKLSAVQLKTIQDKELQILVEFKNICDKHNIRYSLAGGTLIGAVRHKGFIPWDDDIDVYVLRSDLNRLREICPKELKKPYFYQTNETDSDYYYPYDKIRLDGTVFKSPYLSSRNINHGLFIDIFPVDVIPNNHRLRNAQYYEHRILLSILLAKFIDINKLNGKKRVFSRCLRLISKPISIKKIYKLEESVASRYSDKISSSNYVSNLNIPLSYGKKGIYPAEWFNSFETIKFENHNFLVTRNYDQMLKQLYGDYMKLPPLSERTTEHDLIELKI